MTVAAKRAGEAQPAADAADETDAVDSLLERVASPAPLAPAAAPGLRSARLVELSAGRAKIANRRGDTSTVDIAPEVDVELLERALENGDSVLVEDDPDVGPAVVGVLQQRIPQKLELRAEEITIEGDREVLIRVGKAALRLREDGDVELVGSRILTMSRGLFRLVGRVLRLN